MSSPLEEDICGSDEKMIPSIFSSVTMVLCSGLKKRNQRQKINASLQARTTAISVTRRFFFCLRRSFSMSEYEVNQSYNTSIIVTGALL